MKISSAGLTVIPQALAYAGIANLPAAYGLYGSFLGCFIYIFLGSCKDVPMGRLIYITKEFFVIFSKISKK
jgi:MFS superfamily sulfate permease-like transporter